MASQVDSQMTSPLLMSCPAPNTSRSSPEKKVRFPLRRLGPPWHGPLSVRNLLRGTPGAGPNRAPQNAFYK